jgi:hypothetical protein
MVWVMSAHQDDGWHHSKVHSLPSIIWKLLKRNIYPLGFRQLGHFVVDILQYICDI